MGEVGEYLRTGGNFRSLVKWTTDNGEATAGGRRTVAGGAAREVRTPCVEVTVAWGSGPGCFAWRGGAQREVGLRWRQTGDSGARRSWRAAAAWLCGAMASYPVMPAATRKQVVCLGVRWGRWNNGSSRAEVGWRATVVAMRGRLKTWGVAAGGRNERKGKQGQWEGKEKERKKKKERKKEKEKQNRSCVFFSFQFFLIFFYFPFF